MKYIIESNINETVPVLVMCSISILLMVIIIIRATQKKSSPRFITDGILLLGLVCFSYPVFGLLTGLYHVSVALLQAGEISSTLLWGGIQHSVINLGIGLIALHVSAICWFIARRFKINLEKTIHFQKFL